MPSSPDPIALSVYEGLFARHHGTTLRIQQEIGRCRNNPRSTGKAAKAILCWNLLDKVSGLP